MWFQIYADIYLKGFYTYKKTNRIFLQFHHYLFGMPKIIEIGSIFLSKKHSYITNTHINRFGPPLVYFKSEYKLKQSFQEGAKIVPKRPFF